MTMPQLRSRCLHGTWACLTIAAALAVASPAARATDHPLDIRPAADTSWGGEIQNVDKVLHSAAEELWRYFPERALKPILVEPKGGPITLYSRGPNGEYLVRQIAREFAVEIEGGVGNGHTDTSGAAAQGSSADYLCTAAPFLTPMP